MAQNVEGRQKGQVANAPHRELGADFVFVSLSYLLLIPESVGSGPLLRKQRGDVAGGTMREPDESLVSEGAE